MADPRQASSLHPAEHRAYRELYLAARQLLVRWRRLAAALDDTPAAAPLALGGGEIREMLAELGPLTSARGVHGGPAAQGAGVRLAQLRTGLVDRSVDAGMAARLAVLDAEHVATLLLQLAELARTRGDAEMEAFAARWAKRVRGVVKDVRRAAVSLGADPDRVAAPLDDSSLSRALHGAGWALGSAGEWLDRRMAGGTGGSESPPRPG